MKSEEPIEEVSKVFETDTSDWNTYSNEKYSFELRYPKGWTVVENAQRLKMRGYRLSLGPRLLL